MSRLRHLTVGFLTLSTPSALAQAWQPPAAIDAAVAAQVPGAAPVDPRLRLPACRQPLVVGQEGGAAMVRCTAPAWRLRVPVAAPLGSDPVTATPAPLIIARGDPVTVVIATEEFSVVTRGLAEDDATTGARVRVKAGAQLLVGRAIEPGVVGVR